MCRLVILPAVLLLFLAAPVLSAQETRPASVPVKGRFATDPEQIVRPTMVSAEWLKKRLADVVVIDTREKAEEYAAGHIPGARHAPAGTVRAKTPAADLLPPADLSKTLADLGISNNSDVVIYAADKFQDATHFAMALLSVGHEKLAILEGGLDAWRFMNGELSQASAGVTRGHFEPRESKLFRPTDAAEVAKHVREKSAVIVDSRPKDQFTGEVKNEVRGGHIPGSRNRPVSADWVKTPEGFFLRPMEDLMAGYAETGADRSKTVVATCRSGHQASQTYFILKFLLGYEEVLWYDGSWKDWAGRPELPAAEGEEKP